MGWRARMHRSGGALDAGGRRAALFRRRHHLFWHVFAYGVALIVLVGVTVPLVTTLLGSPPAWREMPSRTAEWVAARLHANAGDPGRLTEELRSVSESYGVRVSVWRPDGGPLAGDARDALPEERRREADAGEGDRHGLYLHALRDGAVLEGYVEVAFPGGPGWRLALGVGVALLAVAGVSLLPARRISRPLEHLTAAVRRLGGGDLTTRTNLCASGEVGELARAFDEMAERVERLVRGEKELIANVSHELRTPLARIRIALETAEEGDADEARASLGEIATDLGELEQLVDDVLTSSRLDVGAGGKLPLRTERVAGGDVVGAAVERFAARFPRHTVTLEAAAELPALDADPGLLRRAIDNLLDNARKYGGDTEIRLVARCEGGGLVVEVRDEGPGIPAAELARVFEPFYRADRSRSRRSGGVGLGLPLARRIAEAHGGTLVLESQEGEWTVARLWVPAVM